MVNGIDVFPGIRYTGRLAGDPLGQMTQGEGVIINGTGVQTTTNSRWGDYTSMNVDPVDDCTFWYVNEYYTAAGQASRRRQRLADPDRQLQAAGLLSRPPGRTTTGPARGQAVLAFVSAWPAVVRHISLRPDRTAEGGSHRRGARGLGGRVRFEQGG